jgi:uncharacterized protein YacL
MKSKLVKGFRRRGGFSTRYLFVLIFAIAAAVLFATAGPALLAALFDRISAWFAPPQTLVVPRDRFDPNTPQMIVPMALAGALIGALVGTRMMQGAERLFFRWDDMDVGDRVTFFVGIFSGLVASVPFLMLFQALNLDAWARILMIVAVIFGFIALFVYALQSMTDVLPWNRTRRKGRRSGIKILDTNVIIDGRVYDVAKTGFLEGQMYVPGFVLDELQYIADSHDPLRRQRGRRGLEVLRHMQNEFNMEIRVHDRLAPDQGDGVDARLVRLAQALGADLLTNDHNLNRVAGLQEVQVLSLNELALSLRPNVLPKENLDLMIVREGSQYGQGVGYLEDGTMVVVENGKAFVGEHVRITVTQVHQTEKGKMIFGEIDNEEEGDTDAVPRRRSSARRTGSA